jgi:hypothetical protein
MTNTNDEHEAFVEECVSAWQREIFMDWLERDDPKKEPETLQTQSVGRGYHDENVDVRQEQKDNHEPVID